MKVHYWRLAAVVPPPTETSGAWVQVPHLAGPLQSSTGIFMQTLLLFLHFEERDEPTGAAGVSAGAPANISCQLVFLDGCFHLRQVIKR